MSADEPILLCVKLPSRSGVMPCLLRIDRPNHDVRVVRYPLACPTGRLAQELGVPADCYEPSEHGSLEALRLRRWPPSFPLVLREYVGMGVAAHGPEAEDRLGATG